VEQIPLLLRTFIGLLYRPWMIGNDCGAISVISGRVNWSTRRKPAPMPLCPPQTLHDLICARTLTAEVGKQRLTAWALAVATEMRESQVGTLTVWSFHMLSFLTNAKDHSHIKIRGTPDVFWSHTGGEQCSRQLDGFIFLSNFSDFTEWLVECRLRRGVRLLHDNTSAFIGYELQELCRYWTRRFPVTSVGWVKTFSLLVNQKWGTKDTPEGYLCRNIQLVLNELLWSEVKWSGVKFIGY
jgi:hypothetical protein